MGEFLPKIYACFTGTFFPCPSVAIRSDTEPASASGALSNLNPQHRKDTSHVLTTISLSKTYGRGDARTVALDKVNFEINEGEMVVILGPSGSGKSTLLNMCGCLDTPSSGEILVNGANIASYSQKEQTAFRRAHLGFVFQSYSLLPNLTVRENVETGARLASNPVDMDMIIETVGLADKIHKFPSQLSGGEQQRVSIARAVAKNPAILLCDEPTGALDETTGKTVLSMLQRINRDLGTGILLITHNHGIASMAHRVARMNSGKIASLEANTHILNAQDIRWA